MQDDDGGGVQMDEGEGVRPAPILLPSTSAQVFKTIGFWLWMSLEISFQLIPFPGGTAKIDKGSQLTQLGT